MVCALFAKEEERKYLNWGKKNEILPQHNEKLYHCKAVDLAKMFATGIENPTVRITAIGNQMKLQNIEENRHMTLHTVAESVLYCGRQCITLRGNQETLNTTGNPGNFLSVMKLVGNHDPIVKQHLEKPKFKNPTYLSAQTQNKMIDIIGNQMIQKSLVEEIREAKYFTILSDEAASHNQEQIALCIRFVDENQDIREELIKFEALERTIAHHIASSIKNSLQQIGLDISLCRGQGYDGCTTMAGEKVGVQGIIKQVAPLAFYTHCAGHKINLVIAHSCGITGVSNTDKLKTVCLFALLVNIMETEIQHTGKREPLIDLCRTRWAERHEAYTHFYNSYLFIVKSLEVIAYGMHREQYSKGGHKIKERGMWPSSSYYFI